MTEYFNDPAARAGFHAQAIATMGECPAWDAAITAFVTTDIVARAHQEFGPLKRARNDSDLEKDELDQKHGKGWHNLPEHQATWERLCAAGASYDDAISERYYSPMWEAQRRLVLTPAPTLAALVVKAAVMEWHEVWNDSAIEQDGAELLEVEARRLTGAGA